MTAVVESARYLSIVGDLKIITIQSSAACATGHTIDLGTDSAGGAINTILNTIVQDDAGADKDCTWDPDTGIITMGTLSTGIHNITVIGI